jgi:hypothetical protein
MVDPAWRTSRHGGAKITSTEDFDSSTSRDQRRSPQGPLMSFRHVFNDIGAASHIHCDQENGLSAGNGTHIHLAVDDDDDDDSIALVTSSGNPSSDRRSSVNFGNDFASSGRATYGRPSPSPY